MDSFHPPPHGSPEALRSYVAHTGSIKQTGQFLSGFRVRPGCCWAAAGSLSDRCDRVGLQRCCVALIHKSTLGQRVDGLLGVVQTCFLGRSFCSTWLGFLTGICQFLSPECDICGSGTPLIGPHGTFGCGRLGVLARWPCYYNCLLWGGIPSVQGVINLIPRRVVWDSLGFTPPPPPPPLGSLPDFIWNSVDPYCGVLPDMK